MLKFNFTRPGSKTHDGRIPWTMNAEKGSIAHWHTQAWRGSKAHIQKKESIARWARKLDLVQRRPFGSCRIQITIVDMYDRFYHGFRQCWTQVFVGSVIVTRSSTLLRNEAGIFIWAANGPHTCGLVKQAVRYNQRNQTRRSIEYFFI